MATKEDVTDNTQVVEQSRLEVGHLTIWTDRLEFGPWLTVVDNMTDAHCEGFQLIHEGRPFVGEQVMIRSLRNLLAEWNVEDAPARSVIKEFRRLMRSEVEEYRRCHTGMRQGGHIIGDERDTPPRIAEQWLSFCLPFEDQHIVDEMNELYQRRVDQHGRRIARRWYAVMAGGILIRRVPWKILQLMAGAVGIDWTRYWR